MGGPSKLVGQWKILQHVLTDLVPPIERSYTCGLFRSLLHGSDDDKFLTIMRRYRAICERCLGTLIDVPLEGFNSSIPKIIGNAIMGYMFAHRKRR